ncbi:winged helix-turn-helix transcriptional regulator [bacterium]|nr:winged helix-turn-helix transcriptional regulator [bacterium]
MNDEYIKQCNILKALSHPVRLKLAIGLYKDECSVNECKQKLNVPQSTVSQYLRILKNAKIVEDKRSGTTICYRVVNNLAIEIIKTIIKE